MTEETGGDRSLRLLLDPLMAVGEGGATIEQKLKLLQFARGRSREKTKQVDRLLLEKLIQLRRGLEEARENQERLSDMLDKLTSPPWHPAIFLGLTVAPNGQVAVVHEGNARRAVTIGDEIDPNNLQSGDEVWLGNERNTVVAKSSGPFMTSGELASFSRWTGDGRMVLESREEEVIVRAAAILRGNSLRAGDLVRWERNLGMAFERIERAKSNHLFLEETPKESFDDVGGLGPQIEVLKRSISLRLDHREVTNKYRLPAVKSILLTGPPGTGKTMMARALANWLARISESGRARFMYIKPASLHSMWYSQSEANYREAFRLAGEAGAQEPSIPFVMFFDEVDSIGASRGEALVRVDDRVLTAFMTELDGFEIRRNVLVVAATNRRDAIDPALLRPGRLGDLMLEIPRPNMAAAREIFSKHLFPEVPYAPADQEQNSARQEIIESIVSRIYAPNGDHDLATLTFRDGGRRSVQAKDLISGASIAKIARSAAERACLRELETGEEGVQLDDLVRATAEEFDEKAQLLTPWNCKNFINDLPYDAEVVAVQPIERKVPRPQIYLNVA